MAPEKPFQFVRAGKLHFFCPLCRYHQSTSTIDRVQAKHHVQIAIFTVAITMASYPIFGLKGLSLYLVFWMVFEFFYRLRKRQALVCESCGFDPFLYKQDVHKARHALRRHWETRITNENLFANLKLKNYQTTRVNKPAEHSASPAVDPAQGRGAPDSPAAKSP